MAIQVRRLELPPCLSPAEMLEWRHSRESTTLVQSVSRWTKPKGAPVRAPGVLRIGWRCADAGELSSTPRTSFAWPAAAASFPLDENELGRWQLVWKSNRRSAHR